MSLAAVALMFIVVRELSGETAALWAALLMALAGPQVQYAQEARNYAMLLVEGLGAAAALVLIERRGPTRWRELALVVCLLAMTLTHYFALGTILSLAIYAAVRLRGRGSCASPAASRWPACLGGSRRGRRRCDSRGTSPTRSRRSS
jgi:uncharacterized membrane protein